jgi:hypothetical protein
LVGRPHAQCHSPTVPSPPALRLLLPPASPEERAGTLAASYVLSYLAMSVPAVFAGLLTMRYAGLETAVLLYAGWAGLLALAALVALATSSRHPHSA